MTFFHRTLGTTAVVAATVFGLTSLAHADVVFDGSSWSATTSGNVTSSTTGSSTTLKTATSVSGGVAGSDYVNLSTPITSNSGVWTLSTTVSFNVPADTGQFATIDLGFGNFTNTGNSLNNASAGNSTTGPWLTDTRQPVNPNLINFAAYHIGTGNTLVGGTFTNVTNTPEPQTVPMTFQIVLDTSNWSLEFFKNDVQQSFNGPGNTTVNQLFYANNPGTLSQFGISLTGDNEVTSATFSNLSLTDTVQAVPEASTWAMMMLGFAGLGLLSYRRSRREGVLNFRFA